MEDLYLRGRTELQPDTTSFNTVLNALAHSGRRGSEDEAEALLEYMDELSSREEALRSTCRPDNFSFNIVLKCWARSRDRGAAERADAILRHVECRWAEGSTPVQPDAAAYNTVLTAWARSGANNATARAERVLRRMEDAYRNGNAQARPNALTYNVMINAYAKSKDPSSVAKAIDVLNLMKRLSEEEPGREDCRPDVYSYTAACDALAKLGTFEASMTAEALLEELETTSNAQADASLKPNIRLYTSVGCFLHNLTRIYARYTMRILTFYSIRFRRRSGDSCHC